MIKYNDNNGLNYKAAAKRAARCFFLSSTSATASALGFASPNLAARFCFISSILPSLGTPNLSRLFASLASSSVVS